MRVHFEPQLKFGYFRAGSLVGFHVGFLTFALPNRPSKGFTTVGVDLIATDIVIMVRDRLYLQINLFDKLLGKSRYFFYPMKAIALDEALEIPCDVQVGSLDRNRPLFHRLKQWLRIPMGRGYQVIFAGNDSAAYYSTDIEDVKKTIGMTARIRNQLSELKKN